MLEEGDPRTGGERWRNKAAGRYPTLDSQLMAEVSVAGGQCLKDERPHEFREVGKVIPARSCGPRDAQAFPLCCCMGMFVNGTRLLGEKTGWYWSGRKHHHGFYWSENIWNSLINGILAQTSSQWVHRSHGAHFLHPQRYNWNGHREVRRKK